MKLAIVRGGGLAGISTTTSLRSDSLPAAEAEELESKARGASLLSAPIPSPAAPNHPDGLLYEITVDHDGQQHTHRFTDASLPDEVRSLIEWVDARAERP